MIHSEGFPQHSPIAPGSWSYWQSVVTHRGCAREGGGFCPIWMLWRKNKTKKQNKAKQTTKHEFTVLVQSLKCLLLFFFFSLGKMKS